MKQIISFMPHDPMNYVREVTARYIGPRRKSLVISSSDIAAGFMRMLLKDDAREHFIALYLSGSHRVVSYSLVSIGTANATTLHPREVFQAALLVGACAIIVGHNHPSGDLNESTADINITKTLKNAADLIGIPLLDHIIFSRKACLSMRDQGRFCFD
jgi:DNA repair protein RadC